MFFNSLAKIVLEVQKEYASPEAKVILKAQEQHTNEIIECIDKFSKQSTIGKQPTTLILYTANMQGKSWKLSGMEDAIRKNHFVENEINLSLINAPLQPQDGKEYWANEQKSLESAFAKKVYPTIGDKHYYSIFALAPIPLLINLGFLFANVNNAELYQLHKDSSSWQWKEGCKKLKFKEVWHNDLITSNDAVIMLSLSGKVNIENIRPVINLDKTNLVEIFLDEPNDDFLKSKDQLDSFMNEYRIVKEKLYQRQIKTIHLFAAIPVSLAVCIGKCFNVNFDKPIVTYDFKQGRYSQAITIGG